MLAQQSMGTYVVLASDSSVYGSGFAQGCDDAGIVDPSDRSINQTPRNQSFTSDEFTRGYASGFDLCSKNRGFYFLGLNIKPELSIGDIGSDSSIDCVSTHILARLQSHKKIRANQNRKRTDR